MVRIAVIGAGVVGLSTALKILEEIQGQASEQQQNNNQPHGEPVSVTVIADKPLSETTSYGVPGLFRPTYHHAPGIPPPLFKRWLAGSWKRFDSLVHSVACERAGAQIVSGYQFTDTEEENELEKDFVYNYRTLTNQELVMFPNTQYKHGRFTTSITVEPAKYLKYLADKIRERGGYIIFNREIKSLQELADIYDIVVNCTGLGSKELVKDKSLVPRRGYLIRMKAPWIKHFLFLGSSGLLYAIPGQGVLHVGGVRTDNDLEGRVRSEERDRILTSIYEVLPSLRGAEIVDEFVSWRPHREPVRVESETVHLQNNRTLKVVHNYGHGALGVTLSWGTAEHAAELVLEHMKHRQLATVLKSQL